MEDRIFFKDKTETLKGPFTELQIHDLYRKRSFDSSVLFYFTRNDDFPSDEENSGITLDSLQSLNGFGCPFFKVDENETRGYKEEKLASCQKEIAKVQKECSAVFFMEKMIERMERELEVTESDCKSEQKKKKKKKRSKKSKRNSDDKEEVINEEQREEKMNEEEKKEVINEQVGRPIEESEEEEESEILKYRKMREELSEIKISEEAADAEYTAHYSQLHQIFFNCGIYFPRACFFDISCLVTYAIEEQIHMTQILLETCSYRKVSSANGMEMIKLHTILEEAFHPNYFDRICQELPLIRKYLNEYILSTAADRRRKPYRHRRQAEQKEHKRKQKAEEDFASRREVLEKVFDILPPEHFTFCIESVPSMKLCLEQYISSTANIRKHHEIEAPKPYNKENKQKTKKKKKKIERPNSIPDEDWKHFYDLGRDVSNFVLYAFALFESGDFGEWDKETAKNIVSSIGKKNEANKRYKRDLICEYVLVERMKEKEFFCCLLCEETLFNWKQAMIHFASNLHKRNEKCDIHPSIIEGFRRVLNSVTELPAKLGLSDFQAYVELYTNSGIVYNHDGIPSTDFIEDMYGKYSSVVSIVLDTLTDEQRSAMEANKLVFEAETLIGRAKSKMGLDAMDELDTHLLLGETQCGLCLCKTGNREGFYSHLLSAIHVHNVYASMRKTEEESFKRFFLLAILVNVHKKNLI